MSIPLRCGSRRKLPEALVDLGIMIPSLTTDGHLPMGRHRCDLTEFQQSFVADAAFKTSAVRQEIYGDLAQVVELFRSFANDLIEVVWIGGSFTSSKTDPGDIDCLFVLDQTVFNGLSKTQQAKLLKLKRKDYVREKFGLKVEPFILVREEFENPWEKDWVADKAVHYLAARGAWDDWWQRIRNDNGGSSSKPVRGYLEVTL